jgi:hypothetical protein
LQAAVLMDLGIGCFGRILTILRLRVIHPRFLIVLIIIHVICFTSSFPTSAALADWVE